MFAADVGNRMLAAKKMATKIDFDIGDGTAKLTISPFLYTDNHNL